MARFHPLVVILFSALASCTSPFGLAPPRLVAQTPAVGEAGVGTNAIMNFRFNAAMDRISTEAGFSLAADGQAVDGWFNWANPSNLTFTPKNPLYEGMRYEGALSARAEDERGNNLSGECLFHFTTAGDGGEPAFSGMVPADRSTLTASPDAVVLHFDHAMDSGSVADGLSISASTGYVLRWDGAQKSFTATLREPLPWGATVRVKLPAGTRARNGKKLRDALSLWFRVGGDEAPPSLDWLECPSGLGISNGGSVCGIDRGDALLLRFSDAVDRASVQAAFKATPAFAPIWLWPGSNRASLSAEGGFDGETTYRMELAALWQNAMGVRTTNRFACEWRTDHSNARSLSVLRVSDSNRSALEQNAVAPVPSWPRLLVDFSAPLLPASVVSAVTLLRVSGTGLYGGAVEQFGFEESETRLVLRLGGLAPGNVYKLVITGGKGGARDRRGNPMKADWVYFFQT